MNYIDIKEAIEKTGKSERTIRRLFSNADSKPYIQRKGNKTLIEVNYLFSIYEAKKEDKKQHRQNYAIAESWHKQEDVNELKTKLALAEQELKNKELLLQEKEDLINNGYIKTKIKTSCHRDTAEEGMLKKIIPTYLKHLQGQG